METMFTPSPAAALPEITTEPLVTPTEIAPAPAKTRLDRAWVPVLLWVVLLLAYIVTAVPPPPAPTDMDSCKPTEFMVMEPEIFAPLNVVPVPA